MVNNKFKFPKTFLTIILLTAYCIPLTATVRYVSHEGSNTPPYLTWETAADSIMSAINISVFGDTIYVANGVYEEQVIMIPGLTLIGAGMDSSVISQPEEIQFYCVVMSDNSTIDGFRLIPAHYSSIGIFAHYADSVKVKNMRIPNMWEGVQLMTSGGLIENSILTDTRNIAINQDLSISRSEYDLSVINNFITTTYNGIYLSFADVTNIISNFIFMSGGYIGLGTDCVGLNINLFNNLVVSINPNVRPLFGLDLCNNFNVRNNFIFNEFQGASVRLRFVNEPFDFINNVIMNGDVGLNLISQTIDSINVHYNDFWQNNINYPANFTPDSTNLLVDPMIVNEDSTQGELDFHLQKYSQLIDAGDPNILDLDGTRSDIGLYGGPFGERYKYLDLAPKPPRNLSATIDSNFITLTWNPNTEADFNSYNLFRDTTANFTADSTTFVASLTDTFYIQIIPEGIDAFYYKPTATDNQGNESQPSEELAVIITSVNEYPAAVSNYQLYQNYPNPFNPSTKIGYKLKERGYVKLYVYDIKGELVKILVNEYQTAGYYEVEFRPNGSERVKGKLGLGWATGYNDDIASGIYIYQIMVKSDRNIPVFTDMNKMILLR